MSSTPTHHLQHILPQQEALNLEVNPRNNSNVSDMTSRALEASRKAMEEALGVTQAKRFCSDDVWININEWIFLFFPNCYLQLIYFRIATWCTQHFQALISKLLVEVSLVCQNYISLVNKSCFFCWSFHADGRSQIDSQLAVSMEINGILYHGILFAQSNRSRLS